MEPRPLRYGDGYRYGARLSVDPLGARAVRNARGPVSEAPVRLPLQFWCAAPDGHSTATSARRSAAVRLRDCQRLVTRNGRRVRRRFECGRIRSRRNADGGGFDCGDDAFLHSFADLSPSLRAAALRYRGRVTRTLPLTPSRAAMPSLGLGPNWRQFTLLVALNAFVGGMVGMERSVLPLLAGQEFGVASKTAAISFIATFGLAKALANLLAGPLSERYTRRRVLIAGWLLGVPVPFLLIWAPTWSWVIGANALLGLNHGLAWSMTVNMKIDLVGPSRRGLALGLNEAAGYLSVAAAAFATGLIADRYGLRPEPFYLGIAIAAGGLALSVLFVKDTRPHLAAEAEVHPPAELTSLRSAFATTSWRDGRLFGMSQAGFVNNLNDALAWGIFPLLFVSRG